MTIFGYGLLALGVISLLVSMMRRTEWLLVICGVVCCIGVVLPVMQWYVLHYIPSPHGGAGFMMKFSNEMEARLLLQILLVSLVCSTPLIGYGVGALLRQQSRRTQATRGV